MSCCQGYEHAVWPVEQGAGVRVAGGLWPGPVCEPDQTVGGQRADPAVCYPAGL